MPWMIRFSAGEWTLCPGRPISDEPRGHLLHTLDDGSWSVWTVSAMTNVLFFDPFNERILVWVFCVVAWFAAFSAAGETQIWQWDLRVFVCFFFSMDLPLYEAQTFPFHRFSHCQDRALERNPPQQRKKWSTLDTPVFCPLQQPLNLKSLLDATIQDASRNYRLRFAILPATRGKDGWTTNATMHANKLRCTDFDWNRSGQSGSRQLSQENSCSLCHDKLLVQSYLFVEHIPGLEWLGQFFFRPTPSWLPPGRYTRSIAAKRWIVIIMQGCLLVDSHKSTGSGPVRSPTSSPSKKPNKKHNQKQKKPSKPKTHNHNQTKQNTEKWDRYQQWE